MRTHHQPGPDDDVRGPSAVWPLAVLLTDDRAAAEQLLATALAGRHRSLGRAVVSAALSEPDTGPRPEPATSSPGRPADGEALTAALRALPRRTRTLAVVGLVDLPAGDAVAVPPAEVEAAVAALRAELDRQDEQHRIERARYEALFRVPGSAAPAPEPDRTPLPDRLRALAARTPLPSETAASLLQASGELRRSRRRSRLRVLAGVLALTVAGLLAVLVPRDAGPQAAAAAVDVYAGPPRGSLAGDPEFLDALRARSWSGTDLATEPPPADRRVVWAGEVDGGRAALLISGEGTPDVAAAWFAGPPGATAGQLRLQAVQPDPDRALPVALTAPVRGALVVVGAPGDRVQVSARPVLGADGTASRTFSAATTDQGVATVALPRSTPGADAAVRFRVIRGGRQLDTGPPDVVAEPDPGPPTLPTLRTAPAPAVPDGVVAQAVRDVLSRLGQRADTSRTTVLWSGDVPGPDDRPTRVGVVAVPQPAGSVVVTALYGYDDRTGGPCATGVLPAGPALDQRVVAVPCDLGGPSSRLLVLAPRGADVLRLLDTDGVLLEERAMDDGFAVVASPSRLASVEVRTADGRTQVAETPAPLDLDD